MIDHLTPPQLIAVIIVAALAIVVVMLLASEDLRRFERWKETKERDEDV